MVRNFQRKALLIWFVFHWSYQCVYEELHKVIVLENEDSVDNDAQCAWAETFISYHISHSKVRHVKQNCRHLLWRVEHQATSFHHINGQELSLVFVYGVLVVIFDVNNATKLCVHHS